METIFYNNKMELTDLNVNESYTVSTSTTDLESLEKLQGRLTTKTQRCFTVCLSLTVLILLISACAIFFGYSCITEHVIYSDPTSRDICLHLKNWIKPRSPWAFDQINDPISNQSIWLSKYFYHLVCRIFFVNNWKHKSFNKFIIW